MWHNKRDTFRLLCTKSTTFDCERKNVFRVPMKKMVTSWYPHRIQMRFHFGICSNGLLDNRNVMPLWSSWIPFTMILNAYLVGTKKKTRTHIQTGTDTDTTKIRNNGRQVEEWENWLLFLPFELSLRFPSFFLPFCLC